MSVDKKITQLTEDTSPTSDDLVVTVNDPSGTPANKKVTLANLVKGLGLASTDDVTFNSVNGLTVATGANTFSLTRGTGSLDVAAGKTVNIDDDVTITNAITLCATNAGAIDFGAASKTLTISETATIDQDLQQSASPTFGGITLTGDITTTGGAIDWDLIDNNAAAVSFDASGQAGIFVLDTTNSYEGILRKGLKTVCSSESVNDDAEITIETGKTGWGFAQAGDNEEYAHFTFTAAGAVTLLIWSANTVNTDTDAKFCIYDAGSGIAIKNRLGSAKTVRYSIHYS